jgi:hypothetical protein
VSLALFSFSGRHPDQKAERQLAMATAPKQARADHQVACGTGGSLQVGVDGVLIFADNGGGYEWTIVAANGGTLSESASFAS